MGQTLSHGVYLPNEGERNCYAGLASNWQILNTAVGAIAEKAPLVHTHTVSQITDFPAYGNTAGTICEGNDSRLSDARTPVAHTHGKADITDLLNSNFIPSANNSYDLGSSSNQWNNLYAKKVNTQSVNGINPGALSFPNLEYSDSNKWIDIASSITNTAGADNWYYPAVDGWVFIIASGGAAPDLNVLVFVGSGLNFISGAIPAAESSTGSRWCQCLAPAGSGVRIRFNKGSTSCSIEKAFFVPCQGNV